MLRITAIFLLSFPLFSRSQSLPQLRSGDLADILTIMDEQQEAWNNGDLESFMNGYWESDSLMFVGSGGVTYGYHNTYRRYKQGYPDQAAMGQLTFDILHVVALNKKSALMVGKWHLDRKDDELGGHFSLTWRKISGRWVIVADHSS